MRKLNLAEISVETKNGSKIDYQKVKECLCETGLVKTDRNQLFVLNGEQKLAVAIGCGSKETIFDLRYFFFDEATACKLNSKRLKEVVEDLVSEPAIYYDFKASPYLVNTDSGVFNLLTGKLEEADDVVFNVKLAISYLGAEINLVSGAPRFVKFLNTSLDIEFNDDGSVVGNEEKYLALMQGIGYILSNVSNMRKAMFLLGATASGKSTILRLIDNVVFPKTSVTHYGVRQLTNHFSLGSVSSSVINLTDEMDELDGRKIEVLKQLVSGGYVTAARKYQCDADVKSTVKFMFCSNTLPIDGFDGVEALLDRLLLIIFPKTIPAEERELDLDAALVREKDAIVSAALNIFSAMLKQNSVFTVPEDTKEYLAVVNGARDSDAEFIEERLVLDPVRSVATKNVLQAYEKFCKENAVFEKSRNCLYAAIRYKFGKQIEFTKIRDPFSRASLNGIKGVCLKDE